ncbi:MAG: hypothetical protein Q9191_007021, partial [Dirinaria sp. TL-2023a]
MEREKTAEDQLGVASAPSGVLLVGSVPLASTQDVFVKLCSALPQRLHTIPDGETGVRYNYIGWQLGCFPRETIHTFLGGVERSQKDLDLYTIDSIQPTRYDEMAISSYGIFTRMRNEGIIPSDVRFQVSLPTPFNSIQGHVRPEFHRQLEPLYEKRFEESLRRIFEAIPARDLAIQWDLTFDVIALEYDRGGTEDPRFKPHFSPIQRGILDRISSFCAMIPAEVMLAFHLCYGDLRHKHFVEPADTTLLVDLANSITQEIGNMHPIEWFHMPVPKSRIDNSYFQPLTGLDLRGARLYLCLVHANDEEGTRNRIRTVQKIYTRPFGVATECGMGRTPQAELDSILQICKDVT